MTHFYEYCGGGIILFWLAFRVLYLGFSARSALILSIVVVGAIAAMTSEFMFLMMAVFAPFGAILPGLALQNVLGKFIKYRATYSVLELVVILVFYVIFLAAALGVFPVDPYRYGYSPVIGGSLAFLACGYALLKGYNFIVGAVIVGQMAWTLNIGSSNYFDHITHVLLIPVILITLVKTALAPTRQDMNVISGSEGNT